MPAATAVASGQAGLSAFEVLELAAPPDAIAAVRVDPLRHCGLGLLHPTHEVSPAQIHVDARDPLPIDPADGGGAVVLADSHDGADLLKTLLALRQKAGVALPPWGRQDA